MEVLDSLFVFVLNILYFPHQTWGYLEASGQLSRWDEAECAHIIYTHTVVSQVRSTGYLVYICCVAVM